MAQTSQTGSFWQCPKCRKHVPSRWDICRCGFARNSAVEPVLEIHLGGGEGPPDATPYPRIKQAIGLLLLNLLLWLGIAIPLFAAVPALEKHPAVDGVITLVSVGCVLWAGQRRTGANLGEVFPLGRLAWSMAVPFALTIVGGSILLSEVSNLVVKAIPVPRRFEEIMMNAVSGRISMWGSVFAVAIVGPVAEELLFRGLILRGFLAAYGIRNAVLASALLFALFHLNPWQFVPAFVSGLLFAWWRVETGSLLPGIFGHALNNGLGVAASAAGISIRGFSDSALMKATQPLWFDLAGLVLAGIGLWWSFREFKKTRGRGYEFPTAPMKQPYVAQATRATPTRPPTSPRVLEALAVILLLVNTLLWGARVLYGLLDRQSPGLFAVMFAATPALAALAGVAMASVFKDTRNRKSRATIVLSLMGFFLLVGHC